MAEKNEFTITHIVNAPRALVYKAWTDPEHLIHWYAPTGCSIRISKIDAKAGGSFHHCIVTPDGKECWCKGVYLEMNAPEKIVFTMAIADENGNDADAVSAGMDPRWPEETTVSVTLTEHEGKTKIILHQTVSESLAKHTGAYQSWILMFERLEKMLNQ